MLSQNDPNWKLKRINGTNSTIGSFGCLITCICYILSKAGYNVTPDQLATNKELFDGDMWIGWDKLATFYPNMKYVWGEKCSAYPAPVDKIISELRDGYYPIIMLDYAPKVTGLQTHYLVVLDADADGNLKVGDPIDGAEIWLDTRYGSVDEKYKVLKVDVFHFVKPELPNDKWENIKRFLEEKVADEGMVREAFGALADKSQLVKNIETLQNTITAKANIIVNKDNIISELQNELDGAEAALNSKNGYREKLAVILNCTADWDDIIRNVTVAIGNEDKYVGCTVELKNLKGMFEEKLKKQVEEKTYDINLKLVKATTQNIELGNKLEALQNYVKDLKLIISGGRKTLIDKIKILFKIK